MYSIEYSRQFLKDLKLAKKRGLDLSLLRDVVDKLMKGEKLPPKNRPHKLTGDWNGYTECHITPDWLLIYEIRETVRIVSIARTGTHSDLFKK